jgi:UDP-N-acetyl-D-mannosaminuronic acid dehydrogenase
VKVSPLATNGVCVETVCVVGLGYIGLPTATLLASKGYKVHGVDVNARVVDTINRGLIHIYEPGLGDMVKAAVNGGNLLASLHPAPADVFIIAVPTPFKDGFVPDISYVEAATRTIAPFIAPGNLIVLESTSPVGTTELIASWLEDLRPDLTVAGKDTQVTKEQNQVFVAHCPERVLPGQILKELVQNDRIVGGVNEASTVRARQFYESFVTGKVLETNARTAELSKLSENAFRDVNIAFANELSMICDRLDIDVWEVIALANRHPRVNILQPGPGVGGHCIAVDPWFIVDSAPEEARLIRIAREVNNHKPHHVVGKIREKALQFNYPVIACFGLSFKANIDDLRESPAIEVVQELARNVPGRYLVVEPHVEELPTSLKGLPNVELTDTNTALRRADIAVLLVDHRAFTTIDRSLLTDKVVIDTRGLWR